MKKEVYKARALEKSITLFNWKSDDIELPLNPEFYLTEMGALGFKLDTKEWIRGTFTGLLDKRGDFVEFVGTDLSSTPETYHLKNHEQIIVCGNTPLYRPYAEERDFFAEMKAETDTSIYCQLLLSRLNKAIKVENDQQKKQVEKAFQALKMGMPLILVTRLLEELDIVELTDNADIEKMQYLSTFYQQMEKREANYQGIDLDVIDKRAQVSNQEIKQYDDVTTMDYLVMYEMRKKFVEEMRENGFEIEIVPNPVFFDEPKDEDIDEGTFEEAEAEEEAPAEEVDKEKEEEVKVDENTND